MPTWNHRVVQKVNTHHSDEYYYEVHEAHYNDNGELCGLTENPITPYGDDIEGLKWTLEHMLKACDHPILVDGKIDFALWDDEDMDEDI